MDDDKDIGEAIGGGFYAGRFLINREAFALIVAPKALGEHNGLVWHNNYESIEGAKSFNDGMANTIAMAEAGSELAQWAQALTISGFSDWYIPAQDELEIMYRSFKPTVRENNCYMRSGMNLSSIRQTRPYTEKFPLQTEVGLFQERGAEGFASERYWSSTQYASTSGYAWGQGFSNGYQNYGSKSSTFRARAVRRLPIQSFIRFFERE